MRIWLNGSLVSEADAKIGILDRGFLFGDGVYELVRVFNGVGLQIADHIARLRRSLRLSGIDGFDAAMLETITSTLLEANELRDASIYLQVTRGAAPTRAHIPPTGLAPTVVAFASPLPTLEAFTAPDPVRAVLVEDPRWRRCEIKTISLMGNILALLEGAAHGADEAILHRDGLVGEGTSTNVFAVIDGTLVTPPVDADPPILHGVTRLLTFAANEDLARRVELRPLMVSELARASELMVTSSRRIVAPVVELDGKRFGEGSIGPVCRALFAAARERIARECGVSLGDGARAAVPVSGMRVSGITA